MAVNHQSHLPFNLDQQNPLVIELGATATFISQPMKPLPEINPIILLAEPYSFSETELAQALGCSVHSVASWRYNRRRPQTCIKKLAAVVQKKLDKELAKTKVA